MRTGIGKQQYRFCIVQFPTNRIPKKFIPLLQTWISMEKVPNYTTKSIE